MLAEDHRVGVADRRLEQHLGVFGGGRADHLEAGHVGEPGLGVLRMEGPGADPAAGGQADHHRAGGLPAVVELGQHVDHLVEAAGNEVAELHLDHRPVAEERGAGGDAQGAAFGDRGVAHPVRPLRPQALGDPEGAFERPDVLAHQDHAAIAPHLLAERLVHPFDVILRLADQLLVERRVERGVDRGIDLDLRQSRPVADLDFRLGTGQRPLERAFDQLGDPPLEPGDLLRRRPALADQPAGVGRHRVGRQVLLELGLGHHLERIVAFAVAAHPAEHRLDQGGPSPARARATARAKQAAISSGSLPSTVSAAMP